MNNSPIEQFIQKLTELDAPDGTRYSLERACALLATFMKANPTVCAMLKAAIDGLSKIADPSIPREDGESEDEELAGLILAQLNTIAAEALGISMIATHKIRQQLT